MLQSFITQYLKQQNQPGTVAGTLCEPRGAKYLCEVLLVSGQQVVPARFWVTSNHDQLTSVQQAK